MLSNISLILASVVIYSLSNDTKREAGAGSQSMAVRFWPVDMVRLALDVFVIVTLFRNNSKVSLWWMPQVDRICIF